MRRRPQRPRIDSIRCVRAVAPLWKRNGIGIPLHPFIEPDTRPTRPTVDVTSACPLSDWRQSLHRAGRSIEQKKHRNRRSPRPKAHIRQEDDLGQLLSWLPCGRWDALTRPQAHETLPPTLLHGMGGRKKSAGRPESVEDRPGLLLPYPVELSFVSGRAGFPRVALARRIEQCQWLPADLVR